MSENKSRRRSKPVFVGSLSDESLEDEEEKTADSSDEEDFPTKVPPLTPLALFSTVAASPSPRVPLSHRVLGSPDLQRLIENAEPALSQSQTNSPRGPRRSFISKSMNIAKTSQSAPSSPRLLSLSARQPIERLCESMNGNGRSPSPDSPNSKSDAVFARAVSGGSTKCGASVQIEFDSVTNQPLVRVRSYSSIEQLREMIVAAAAMRDNPDLSNDDDDHAPPLMRRLTSPSLRRASKTHTRIDFNPDPLGVQPWSCYLIPDSEITLAMRTYLSAAHDSEKLDQFRVCNCETCVMPKHKKHAPPDLVAKFFGCYMLVPHLALLSTDEIVALAREHRLRKTISEAGLWLKYRVNDSEANADKVRIEHRYRFKMFVC